MRMVELFLWSSEKLHLTNRTATRLSRNSASVTTRFGTFVNKNYLQKLLGKSDISDSFFKYAFLHPEL